MNPFFLHTGSSSHDLFFVPLVALTVIPASFAQRPAGWFELVSSPPLPCCFVTSRPIACAPTPLSPVPHLQEINFFLIFLISGDTVLPSPRLRRAVLLLPPFTNRGVRTSVPVVICLSSRPLSYATRPIYSCQNSLKFFSPTNCFLNPSERGPTPHPGLDAECPLSP